MTTQTREAPATKTVRFERTYEASTEDVWALWTTKEGFESWWGPVGFRVEVHQIDARVGGQLRYDMIADAEAQIAAMKAMGQPLSHATHGVFVEVAPLETLRVCHTIDFLPGVAPYDNEMRVQLFAEGERVRMVVEIQHHVDPQMTRMASEGFESQLTKVADALARRGRN